MPVGSPVFGGFMSQDKVSMVVSFAKCFFTPEKAEQVVLRHAHNASILTEEEMDTTLQAAGLYPRALLIASTQSDESREMAIQQAKVHVAHEVIKSSENAEMLKKKKLADIEALRLERERTISSFREDRSEIKEKKQQPKK